MKSFDFLSVFCEIDVPKALVDFGDGIPAGTFFVDAPLLHEEVDEVFLLTSYFSEVMQIFPNVHVEVIFDALDHGPFARFGDVVVDSRVVGFVVWNFYGDLSLLPCERSLARWELNGGSLQEFALDGATDEGDRVVAPMAVYELLTEVGWHFEVDAVGGHGFG